MFEDDRSLKLEVVFTPKDSLGNYIGPGHVDAIIVTPERGSSINEIVDNLDGTYSQEYEINTNLKENVGFTVEMHDEKISITWENDYTGNPCELYQLLVILLILIIIFLIIYHFYSKKILYSKRQ